MRKTTSTLAALAIVLAVASAADATNFCASFGIGDVVASGLSIPGKGTCKAFNGFIVNEAGVLLAGDICTSSDGSTVLFNLFTQFDSEPDSIAGTFSSSTNTGTGNECVAANTSGCGSFDVTVTKCPKTVTLPDVTSRPESQSGFLTQ
jgi:hypothetical protein